jgi:hypothetical protein
MRQEGTFLVHGLESTMREIFGNVIEKMPTPISVSVWDAPTKMSELPLQLPRYFFSSWLRKHYERDIWQCSSAAKNLRYFTKINPVFAKTKK